MLKVLQVCTDKNVGGAGRSMINFLKNFDKSQLDVDVVLPIGSAIKPMVEQLGINVIEVANIADESFNQKSVLELRALIKNLKPNLVHTHACMSARFAAKSLNIKTIYTRHSVFPPLEFMTSKIGKILNKFVENFTADGIIAVAEAAKNNLIDMGINEKKIRVILNGVEPLAKLNAEEKMEEREKLGVSSNQKIVAIVARLDAVKGHKYFVEAAKIALSRGAQAKFVIVGTGNEQEAIEKQITDEGLESNFVLTGFLHDVTHLMNVMDIQVNASFGTEATSLSLLEGMSLGKPAIVSDFGGNPDVISDRLNGMVVPEKDSEKLADAISWLCADNQLYQSMSNSAVEVYNKKFTAKLMTENIERFYGDVLRGRLGA